MIRSPTSYQGLSARLAIHIEASLVEVVSRITVCALSVSLTVSPEDGPEAFRTQFVLSIPPFRTLADHHEQ